MVHQGDHVVGHGGAFVGGRVVRFAAAPVPATVEGNYPAAGACERTENPGGAPVAGDIAGEAVDEDDGRAVALGDVVDFDSG